MRFSNYASDLVIKVSEMNSLHNFKIKHLESISPDGEITFDDVIKRSSNLNEESMVLLNECNDNILNLQALAPILANQLNHTVMRESILSRLNPEYKEKYLIPAKEHVDNLMKVTSRYIVYD